MITTVPTYFVQSGNWTKIVRATDPMEAATVAIEQVYNSADSKTYKVGVVTLIWDVKDKRDNNLDKQLYLYTPAILANAGFHDIAKKLDDYANGVIKGMTDKNKSEDVE
jgi:hypothetical protein